MMDCDFWNAAVGEPRRELGQPAAHRIARLMRPFSTSRSAAAVTIGLATDESKKMQFSCIERPASLSAKPAARQ